MPNAVQVLGGSFLYASYGKPEEQFSKTRTGVLSALVMAVSVCLTIPTIVSIADRDNDPRRENIKQDDGQATNLFLSHGTSVVLFFLFVSYLIFRFRTHGRLFRREVISMAALTAKGERDAAESEYSEDEEHTTPRFVLALTFAGAIACAVVCADYTVRYMDAATEALHVTRSFIGLLLLPLAGNLAKSFQIISHSREERKGPQRINRLDLAIRSIMTNVLDTLLFITPSLVLLGWAIGRPVTLEFGIFEAVVFLLAIVVMTYLVQHGKTTYFGGFMLMGT